MNLGTDNFNNTRPRLHLSKKKQKIFKKNAGECFHANLAIIHKTITGRVEKNRLLLLNVTVA